MAATQRRMTLLVTRPEPQATQWAQALHAAGVPALPLPLLETAAPEHPETRAALADLWMHLSDVALLMFVSPAAVHWFAQARPEGVSWPRRTLAAAPGPGTARLLRETFHACGMPAKAIISPPHDSGQFDSEHLWPLLAAGNWRDRQVVIVSGGNADGMTQGRRWLQDRLEEAGARVTSVAAYVRRPARWTTEQETLARLSWAEPDAHVWLFSSSQALPPLVARLGPPPAGSRAMATHPRVALQARELGFRHVVTTRPDLDSVARARRDMSLQDLSRPDTPDSPDGVDTIV